MLRQMNLPTTYKFQSFILINLQTYPYEETILYVRFMRFVHP